MAGTTSKENERYFANLSEKENFLKKNYYRLKHTTLEYADKSRMKIEERKVRDMLRNQHIMRDRLLDQIGNFTD